MVAPHWSYKTGAVKGVRIVHKRRFFKSFAVVQVQRELFHTRIPSTVWEPCGFSTWRDVDATDLTEVHEVMALLSQIRES